MRFLAFLLIPLSLSAQTPAKSVPITNAAGSTTVQLPVINVPCPQQNLPKGGGKFTLAMCPLTITLPALYGNISGMQANWTCTTTNGQTNCTLTVVKP